MGRQEIMLDGQWQFVLDPEDRFSDTPPDAELFTAAIRVPGSWEEQGFGEEPPMLQIDTWTKIREYVGAGWYRREVRVELGNESNEWQLVLSGARWSTDVWVNGVHVGRQLSLSVAHVHDVGGALIEGDNEFLVRVDNRMLLPLEDSHIHTRHTATNWGGITGGARLEKLPAIRIGSIALTPDLKGRAFHCRISAVGDVLQTEAAGVEYRIRVRFKSPDGNVFETETPCSNGAGSLICALGDEPVLWSDNDPRLYEAEILLLRDSAIIDRVVRRTGFRLFEGSGQQICLNERPVFLRGYVDCCVFPLTGYPVWEKDHYERQFRIAKSYGFNHVRLHGWNAPEPFWEAADEAGMLVQTELPHWSAFYQPRGAQPLKEADAFFEAELLRIYERLNAHPSFVMFSMGNELIEDNGHERLNELVRLARSLDGTRLVTDNTGFGQLPEQDREGDFFIHSFNWHKPLRTEEIAMPATNRNFSAVTRLSGKPVIGHEHAQFSMYVRPQEKVKYTGVLRPTWLETVEETLAEKGLDKRIDQLIDATGVHQTRSLKEAMERVRRTPGAAGVQLLDIRDFPGQGHATTGLLDVFWDSKGIITPERVLDFNAPTVLLMSCQGRTLFAGEATDIRLMVSHYGREDMLSGRIGWRLRNGYDTLAEGELRLEGIARGEVEEAGTVRVCAPAGATAQAIVLEAWFEDPDGVELAAGPRSIRNEWTFWSFPVVGRYDQASSVWSGVPAMKTALYGATVEPNSRFDPFVDPRERGVKLAIVERLTTNVLQYMANGGHVWLFAGGSETYDAVATKYLPVFWNYLMFSEQVGGTMGAIVHPHPALGQFPHDGKSDWQWYHLFNGSPAISLDAVPGVEPIIEVIDNFNRAKKLTYMFEANVGRGKLFVTSLALREPDDWKRPESAYLFGEILNYLLSDAFRPAGTMTVGQTLGLFRLRGIHSFL
ncbi:glycoside hydrolase family 2 protein [Cohnella lupini]|uniref:Glycosyl hydrolase family 2 n=1 Tax=Cohnella lupini TaxID=1294267 RepID=A0A3D9HUI7_9BACL|nr:sugar-binding domain-containing protein [Cohnella lupini]RED53162.1 glycosyl hydrolase family 2 [Cohnella lupini]